MAEFADLHIHTNYSDSSFSPEEVVAEAHKKGIQCIAIADHDTFKGIEPTRKAAEEYGIEVIAGIELSSEINGKDVHILGYLFDYQSVDFEARLNTMQDTRISRMAKMILKLKSLGIDNIELKEVCDLAQSKSVGRPHLATVLKQKGWVSNIKKAFDKYIAEGAPAYVPKFKQSPQEAIALIREFGGVSVLAHPMITNVDELIPQLVKAGLGGLEAVYPDVSENVRDHYKGLARKHNLVVTGGSDSHGQTGGHAAIGSTKLPYAYVEQLKAAVSRC